MTMIVSPRFDQAALLVNDYLQEDEKGTFFTCLLSLKGVVRGCVTGSDQDINALFEKIINEGKFSDEMVNSSKLSGVTRQQKDIIIQELAKTNLSLKTSWRQIIREQVKAYVKKSSDEAEGMELEESRTETEEVTKKLDNLTVK